MPKDVVEILKEDDLQPSTTTVPIASTLTNPVAENQQRALNDRPTEKGGDKPVVGLKDSMDQGTTPRNLDGDQISSMVANLTTKYLSVVRLCQASCCDRGGQNDSKRAGGESGGILQRQQQDL
ncbi:hypothetical protein BY996DRAFT_6428722 [Phakopsora pachyrhizi]|nr:hypothetical protein BY996DRAFT_6428722 [Phakopsora pachyrhizi]